MHALRCAAAGTRANSSGEKVAFTHQHVATGCPVGRACSMAHWLGLPHKGQAQASIGFGVGLNMPPSVAKQRKHVRYSPGAGVTFEMKYSVSPKHVGKPLCCSYSMTTFWPIRALI